MSILPLEELSVQGESAFGGKACGLARLIAAGASVPAGFAVRATASEWSAELRGEFEKSVADLLRLGPVAVRSSAVGEDSATRSFAGLLETILDLSTPAAALGAATRCIQAGRSQRVREYAGSETPLAVGIVVQTMVSARAAGVCFTRDPSGRDGGLVIEAVVGLGDKLVSGAETPERWRAYRSGLGGWECLPEERRGVLCGDDVESISAEADRIATAIGYPLDLEWAFDPTGTLWWLQARPITAARPAPSYMIQRSCQDANDGPVTVWSNWNVRETLPDPMYPLTWTYWRDVLLPVITHQVTGIPRSSELLRQHYGLDLINGRIYFNMNALLAAPLLGRLSKRMLAIMDSRTGATMDRLLAAGALRRRRLAGSHVLLIPELLKATLLSLLRMATVVRPRHALAVLEQDAVAVDRRPDVRRLSKYELLHEMQLWGRPECRRLLAGLQMEAVAGIIYFAAARMYRAYPEAWQKLTTGISANPTTQISLGVDALADAAIPLFVVFRETRTTPELMRRLEVEPGGPQWLAQLREFLSRFGHRGPMEFDLGASRWAEDPTMIIELVRMQLETPRAESVAARMERLGAARRRAVEQAVSTAPLWRRPIMRALACLVELYMPLREAPKHYGVFVFRRIRLAALELGRRFCQNAVLATPEEVFFIEYRELEALVEGQSPPPGLQDLIHVRRDQLDRFRREPAPDVLRSDGVPVVEDRAGGGSSSLDGVLHGTPVSAGVATGPVRVLSEPDPRAMAEGDIIVMKFADPGWTPLFPRSRAVVMEVGGLMCHAAVVAREMGIPAVFGVAGATSALADGQVVRVDGAAGTVTPL
ncbi:MAG: hypothetical protein HYX75_05950 [Acidobacteria bacterium]|nr:hypothetical protein [Acidobacteriota bacterium]